MGECLDISGGFHGVAGKFFHYFKGVLSSLFITIEDLRGMETHVDKLFSLVEEFSSHCDDEVSSISSFVFLHFGGLGNHFGSRVVHIGFSDNAASVGGDEELFQVVDDHFVHA